MNTYISKTTKFHILDFIDSKDIRDFNQNTYFHPIEQAVLIYYSNQKSVEEKLCAWQELLELYTEEEFQKTRHTNKKHGMKSNKEILSETVSCYNKALENRYITDGVIFQTEFAECLYPDKIESSYFSDYDKAFSHLEDMKQEYLEDEYLKDVVIEARIRVKKLNAAEYGDVFYFDNNLRMIDLFTDIPVDDNLGLESFCIYVPLPFKKGDILRTISPGKVMYGVMSRNIGRKDFLHRMEVGDGTDMTIPIDSFDKCEGKWIFDYEQSDFLIWEKCPDTELPEEQSILRLLSDVYTGQMEVGELLYLYSHYGERGFYGENDIPKMKI